MSISILRYLTVLLVVAVVSKSFPQKSLPRLRELGYEPSYPQHENKQKEGSSLIKYKDSKAVEDYLLPLTTYPISYDVWLIPYLQNPASKNFTFEGRITIKFAAREVTNEVVMHSWDLDIKSISVIKLNDSTMVPVGNPVFSPDDRQFFTISLNSSLEVGQEYLVVMSYTGILNDEIKGFSRSEYIDENGNPEFLAITHLEPTAARRMMPCYDQPDFKARVSVHVAREPGYNVLANMPISSEGDPVEGLDGWVWVNFQETPVMSTYLICLAVHKFSNFANVEDTRFKVWSRPAVVQSGQYASEIIPDVIEYMQQFTNILYDMPKYDQIGMVQFTAGAMENWGLITFTEPLLLYNPETGTTWDKNLVTKVVTHEAAHQWFGNLVSPKWWSSTWLNEGFARYFEYFAIHAITEDWRQNHVFVIEQIYTSFRADINNTHPVYADYVDNPTVIHDLFDTVTYNKGACLVRLMINLLDEDNFKLGINNYLNALAYSNAHQDDLFFHLSPFAPSMPVTFKELMDSWTIQPGYPIITVTRNYAQKTATITQTRFGTTGVEKWIVPLTFTSGDNPDFSGFVVREWLLPSDNEIVVTNGIPAASQWLMFNIQQIGFYRVNYDATNWALISTFMSTPGNAVLIDPVNRAQLMDDAFTFAENGILDYVTALTTTTYLDQESEWLPWTAVTDHLEYIRDRVYSTEEGVTLFQDYMRRKLDLIYNTVNGFDVSETDAHYTLLTRWFATRWACDMDHVTCNVEGSDVFQQWMATPEPTVNNPVAVDLRVPAYCAGQHLGGKAEYDFLMNQYVSYNNNNDVNNKKNVIFALGCASDTSLLRSYLNESFGMELDAADSLAVLESVYSHPIGVEVALNFLLTYWRELDPLYGSVGKGFKGIAPKLNTQQHYDTISQFLDNNSGELGSTNQGLIMNALTIVQNNIAWNEQNLQAVMDFLRNVQ